MGGANCPSPNASFSVTLTFEPLPAGTPAATTDVSDPATPAGASAESTGGAK